MSAIDNGSKPINLTHIYLGVDNSQHNVIRAVCLDADAAQEPWPVWSDRFKSLEAFQFMVRPFLGPDVSVGAISQVAGGQDPFGAVTWLQDMGFQVSPPGQSVAWQAFGGDCESYGLTRAYRRAFSLARAAAYWHQVPRLVWELFSEANHLHQELSDLLERLTRLALVVPFPYGEAIGPAGRLP